jgi:hypothetical protein
MMSCMPSLADRPTASPPQAAGPDGSWLAGAIRTRQPGPREAVSGPLAGPLPPMATLELAKNYGPKLVEFCYIVADGLLGNKRMPQRRQPAMPDC